MAQSSILDTVIYPHIENGVQEVKIKDFEEVKNDQGGYILLKLQLVDRPYDYVLFPSQINVVATSIKNQMFDDDGEPMSVKNILTNAVRLHGTLKVYFYYNEEFKCHNLYFDGKTPSTSQIKVDQ